MGFFGGDWDYSAYFNITRKAREGGKDSVSLSTDHCSWQSDESILAWAKEDDYRAVQSGDSITLYFDREVNMKKVKWWLELGSGKIIEDEFEIDIK